MLYAQSLSWPGELEAELRGVDLRREFHRASLRQFWIASGWRSRSRLLRPNSAIASGDPDRCLTSPSAGDCDERVRHRRRLSLQLVSGARRERQQELDVSRPPSEAQPLESRPADKPALRKYGRRLRRALV
jgi:hypothetical protein